MITSVVKESSVDATGHPRVLRHKSTGTVIFQSTTGSDWRILVCPVGLSLVFGSIYAPSSFQIPSGFVPFRGTIELTVT